VRSLRKILEHNHNEANENNKHNNEKKPSWTTVRAAPENRSWLHETGLPTTVRLVAPLFATALVIMHASVAVCITLHRKPRRHLHHVFVSEV
jgi:hypothetical protein